MRQDIAKRHRLFVSAALIALTITYQGCTAMPADGLGASDLFVDDYQSYCPGASAEGCVLTLLVAGKSWKLLVGGAALTAVGALGVVADKGLVSLKREVADKLSPPLDRTLEEMAAHRERVRSGPGPRPFFATFGNPDTGNYVRIYYEMPGINAAIHIPTVTQKPNLPRVVDYSLRRLADVVAQHLPDAFFFSPQRRFVYTSPLTVEEATEAADAAKARLGQVELHTDGGLQFNSSVAMEKLRNNFSLLEQFRHKELKASTNGCSPIKELGALCGRRGHRSGLLPYAAQEICGDVTVRYLALVDRFAELKAQSMSRPVKRRELKGICHTAAQIYLKQRTCFNARALMTLLCRHVDGERHKQALNVSYEIARCTSHLTKSRFLSCGHDDIEPLSSSVVTESLSVLELCSRRNVAGLLRKIESTYASYEEYLEYVQSKGYGKYRIQTGGRTDEYCDALTTWLRGQRPAVPPTTPAATSTLNPVIRTPQAR